MKRIFKYGLLLPLPEVPEPKRRAYMEGGNSHSIKYNAGVIKEFNEKLTAFNSWKQQGIKPSPELKLVEGSVYEEGVDFKTVKQILDEFDNWLTLREYPSIYDDMKDECRRLLAIPAPTAPTVKDSVIEKDGDLYFLAKNIVNQLFDEAEVPVKKRQEINDLCDEFVMKLVRDYIAKDKEGDCLASDSNPDLASVATLGSSSSNNIQQ